MFNLSNGVPSQSTAANVLKANGIYDVIFKGVAAETIESKKDGKKYNILKIKFADANGATFEDSVFEPTGEKDFKRQANNYGSENPSAVEEMLHKFKHLIRSVDPDLANKIDDGTKPLTAPNWAGLCALMVKATTKHIGKEVQIKLLANKNGHAIFPGFVLGISKEGNVYPRTNFIGANLSFTAKELERIENTATARPSSMPDNSGIDLDMGDTSDAAVTTADLDIDLDDL